MRSFFFLLLWMMMPVAAVAEEPPPAAEPAAETGAAGEAEAEAPVPAPPDLPSRLEDGRPIEPEVTIVRRGEAVVEEYRVNGRMFMVKITPRVGKSYYLLDQDGDGRMETRMSEIYENFAVPQWVIFRW